MTIELGGESFESDLFEVVKNWFTHKDAIPQSWKGDLKPTSPMSYSDLQILGASGCSDLVSLSRRAMKRLKPLSDTLRELASAMEAQSNAVCTNFNAVSNMGSLIFLPNELLVRILQFVVDGDPDQANSARSKAAITLSHVSQYFRNTALSCAALWSYVTGSSDVDTLCFPRSKDALLDVEMHVGYLPNPRNFVLEQSLNNILPYSRRWRSLLVEVQAAEERMQGQNVDINDVFRGLDLRSLESLHLRPRVVSRCFGGLRDFRYLDAPNLRHLTSVHVYPLSLLTLANLTTLNMTFRMGHVGLADLHNDLSRMKALESFSLKLESGNGRSDGHLYAKLEFLRVRQLKIEITNRWEQAPIGLGSFFSSMSFPVAVDFHLKFLGVKHSERNFEFYELRNILQHVTQFPCVEMFCLEANALTVVSRTISSAGETQNYRIPRKDITSIAPLGLLPSLKHLTLCSNGRMLPCLRSKPTYMYWERWTSEEPPEELLIVPSLETVTIRASMPAATGMSSFVAEILQKQKERGDWGKFRELIVVDGDQAKDGGTCVSEHSEAYTGDSALEWCEKRKAMSPDE
ncbi:hypothetical protein SCHPADRAFT_993791 [Schizopora paradoxa]|uniref:F-box domain-containing protein n=1 Tax=Schizopora paradoxa TaxID=27342 RepID=A0A0H2S1I0_9AGAM|nr:hypothetical protein SCHPADRAFT_993791 [Schizopora paradoxa]